MFFFCSYHVHTPMSNILYDRTLRDKPFLQFHVDWIGPVALWGTVVEHKHGYRASHAYPLGLEAVWPLSRPGAHFFDPKTTSRLYSSPELSEAYRIPVADGVIRTSLAITEDHPNVAPFGDLLKLLDDIDRS